MLSKLNRYKSLIAIVLVVALVIQFAPKINIAFGGDDDAASNASLITGETNMIPVSDDTLSSALDKAADQFDSLTKKAAAVLRAPALLGASYDEPVLTVGENSYIIIRNEEQLRKIGTDEEVGSGDLKYAKDAKYIVVNDIELTSDWTPLMFYGEMYGIRVEADEENRTLDELFASYDSLDAATKQRLRPVISNINVSQTEPLDITVNEGTGFFGTITNKSYTDFAKIGVVGPQAVVRNIALENVTVNNATAEVSTDFSVVSTLTSSIGTALGWVLDNLLKVLSIGSVQTDLQSTLSNLLNAKAADPTVKATGAFAGRLVGDVVVEDCIVSGATVTSVNDRAGGFVGYAEGVTEYDGLSQALGAVANGLAAVLNLIPYVGLGDLVTILLGNNALPVGELIPTAYKFPSINRCEISGLSGTVGSDETQFIGGFIGHQIGTKINDCKVTNGNYEIKAMTYGGGFCGNMRDAVIAGTLDGVGINIAEAVLQIHPQSITQRSFIENSIFKVSGGSMLGGFVGVQNSGVIVDDGINCPELRLEVSASEDYAGGFSGYATVGWQSSLGQSENHEKSLLGTVRQLATGLLSSDQSTGQRLLSLMGLAPSTILGSSVNCASVSVAAAGDCAGGLLGKGDGVYVGRSDSAAFENINNWDDEGLGITESPSNNLVTINNLESVSATNYAGGIVGYDGSARFQGLLNNVVGLGDFIGFDVIGVTVNGIGEGYTVTATERNAGGAFGLAMGGNATDITLNNLGRVEAKNRAAGFVGVAGPGELIGSQALTVNLLGLDRVVAVSNLLAVGQGIEVKITGSVVNGVEGGFTVEALGEESEVFEYTAAGFIADSNSTKIESSHVNNLLSVKAPEQNGFAGGFAGTSLTGGLAEAANDDSTAIENLVDKQGNGVNINGLVRAIGYLLPTFTDCTVHFIKSEGFVEGDVAGGFVASLESGTVDNSTSSEPYAVYDIDAVRGQTFGGGFGGKVVSGGLASAGHGLSILGNTDFTLSIDQLLSLVDAYVPYVKYAGVKSDEGFTVEAKKVLTGAGNTDTGAAGGFIGYASGAQISHSDVSKLKHTNVEPPKDPKSVLAPSYFDERSEYAVTGGRHAGGYIGNMDIGSAASIGGGLGVLDALSISKLVSALSVVVTTVEHSKVEGRPGGFAVLATGEDNDGYVGKAGGFAGEISGGHVQDSHAINFSYVIGQEMAGGFVGNFRPGSVANLLDDLSADVDGNPLSEVLKRVADISGLLSLIESFVPTIRNSTTTCVPCGGAVRADAAADKFVQRGCAGGYCGHNEGGQIWGNNGDDWLGATYTGPQSICKADRIHSVYGFEYAGGFTGYMEPASTAQTGNISLLGGLINADNLLDALKVTYPTEENTAVYGPLRNIDIATWNAWVKYVAKYGAYAYEFANAEEVSTEEELEEQINKYAYGTTVCAGRELDQRRNEENPVIITEGGNAGGYVGYMVSGVITNGQAYGIKHVQAMRSAGGFVGKMKTGGLSEFGSLSLFGDQGLQLNLGSLVKLGQVFVPCIKNSSVEGFRSGLKVLSPSDDFDYSCGNAGGYCGASYGGQIWGDQTDVPNPGCDVKNLRYVQGRNKVGGYLGLSSAASVADVNTDAAGGLLQNVLDVVNNNRNGDLAGVLEATVTTVRNATVSAPDQHNEWGFVVEGIKDQYPRYAGGFVGYSEASILGDDEGATKLTVNGLRSVDALYYAGGFVGLADIGGVADVSAKNDNDEGEVSLLYLIELGNTTVLDVFRTYIYHADVTGSEEGLCARAHSYSNMGMLLEERQSGCAGGFGGGIFDGTVKNSTVTGLNTVLGLNYVGGFAGHLGKSGVVGAEGVDVLSQIGLLGLTAGVLDIFGSHIEDCSVEGIEDGAVIVTRVGDQTYSRNINGGFAGLTEVSRIKSSHASNMKLILSDQIAGGFVGQTTLAHAIEADIDSVLLEYVIKVVNLLLRILYIDGLENINILDLQNIPGYAESGIADYFDLHLLSQGDTLYANLLGLRIGVTLLRDTGGEGKDTAVINIGDSVISLPASEDGIDSEGAAPEVHVALLKVNRTKVENCSVTGIGIGYDVYGGGADYNNEGTGELGYAGGFVGFNNEGDLIGNEMVYCDEVKGTPEQVGHFTGLSEMNSTYLWNTLDSIEGDNNRYHVYRQTDYTTAEKRDGTQVAIALADTGTPITYQRFDMVHRAVPIIEYIDWEGATMGNAVPIEVYVTSGKAVLMDGVEANDNGETLIPEPAQDNDPCKQSIDYTVQKIWEDMFNLSGLRPDSIKIRLLVTEVLADGTVVAGPYQYLDTAITGADGYITMSKAEDGRFMSATWTHVIEDLPVAYEVEDENPGESHLVYYRYTVDEVDVPGYYKIIQQGEDYERGMVSTITNTTHKVLPQTGKAGIRFVLLALLLILFAFVCLRVIRYYDHQRKMKQRRAARARYR